MKNFPGRVKKQFIYTTKSKNLKGSNRYHIGLKALFLIKIDKQSIKYEKIRFPK